SQALTLTAGSSTDPGSVPGGGVPALVPGPEVGVGPALRLTAVLVNGAVAAALAVLFVARRRRAHPPVLAA
ncbi:MAG TPA: hypothetical protein VFS16_09110, partial [Acidimicrobiia bacterium]|nr:hypothetical protein [Acidimicrobiia bacterium]